MDQKNVRDSAMLVSFGHAASDRMQVDLVQGTTPIHGIFRDIPGTSAMLFLEIPRSITTVSDSVDSSTVRKIRIATGGHYLWQVFCVDPTGVVLWKSKPRTLSVSGDSVRLKDVSVGSIYYEIGLNLK